MLTLAEATKTGIFKKAYPERHIDCGIAEANMMGIAAGIINLQEKYHLQVHLQCLQQEEHMSR